MNNKISGAQMVLVPIKQLGKNKFPWVENLRNRYIKFIDFYGADYLPGTAEQGLTSTNSIFVTIANSSGNKEFIRNLPLERLDYQQTLGVRQEIGSYISLSDCYVNCQNEAAINTVAAFIFWYDLPEFSKSNATDTLITDSISVPIVTSVRYNQFPDIERMTNKRFRRILISEQSVTPDGNPGVPGSALQNIYMTLCKGSYNVLENVPVLLLYQLAMIQKTEFANIIFDFQSSYLTIGGANSIPVEDFEENYLRKSVFFNVQYEK